MPTSSKERLFNLGKIITGFANVENPDDAVRSYIANLIDFRKLSLKPFS